MIKKFILILLFIGITQWTVFSDQVSIKKPPIIIQERPDIKIESVKLTSKPSPYPGKILIKIEFVLFNDASVPTKCCPTEAGKKEWKKHPHKNWLFEIKVESRSYPYGRFSQLGGKTGTLMGPHEKGTYHATDTILKGSKKQYRIIADHGNWINEKNEKNNRKLARWPLIILKKGSQKVIKR